MCRFDKRITFDDLNQIMEVDFSDFTFDSSETVNKFYDRLEERIHETGEDKWFFLVNLSGMHIEAPAWGTYAHRGKMLNKAHSQGSVRFDASDITRRQIERDANTERFDPNLFADRGSAVLRLASMPSMRLAKIQHVMSFTRDDIKARVSFDKTTDIMEIDLSNLTIAHSADVDLAYDYFEEAILETEQKWFFLINYENCEIYPEAWVRFAHRGKFLNERGSLGSVRFAPGSETEETIRMRAESQAFRPNIRNTREEALERIEEMRLENA